MERAERSPRSGFTLLEVLAAIAVFGIVYTMLAQAAIQGLAAEGDAARRLEASLVADRALGELESQLAAGMPPPLGLSEAEVGDYLVETEVRPFDLAALLPPEVPRFLERPGGARSGRTMELLRAPGRGASPLVEIRVRVRWEEGAFQQTVQRSTFAADATALAPHLEAIGEATETDEDEEEEEVGVNVPGGPNP